MSVLLADTGQTGQLTSFNAYDVRGEFGANCSGATVLKLIDAFERVSGVKIARKFVPSRNGDPQSPRLRLSASGGRPASP